MNTTSQGFSSSAILICQITHMRTEVIFTLDVKAEEHFVHFSAS